MVNNIIKSLIFAVAGSFLMMGVASADMLTGGISFNGITWTPILDGTEVLGIGFNPNTGTAESGTFDFSGLNGKDVTINDIHFTPFVAIDYLWVVEDFSFALKEISVLEKQSDLIALKGVGTISAIGFEDTVGNWSLRANYKETKFLWSSSTEAVPNPEPATMLLFGTGLVGLVAMARRRKGKSK